MSKSKEIIKLSKDKGYFVDKKGTLFNKKGIVLSLSKSTGYFSFGLRIKNSRNPKRVFIHRLQAYQKFGDRLFDEGIVVRHLDNNSMNNSWENISIGNQSQNMNDIPPEKRIIRSSHPIYSHKDIVEYREMGFTYKQIMDKFGIPSKGTISFIINKSLEAKKQ